MADAIPYMNAPCMDLAPAWVCRIWKYVAPNIMKKPNHTNSANPAAITPECLAA